MAKPGHSTPVFAHDAFYDTLEVALFVLDCLRMTGLLNPASSEICHLVFFMVLIGYIHDGIFNPVAVYSSPNQDLGEALSSQIEEGY